MRHRRSCSTFPRWALPAAIGLAGCADDLPATDAARDAGVAPPHQDAPAVSDVVDALTLDARDVSSTVDTPVAPDIAVAFDAPDAPDVPDAADVPDVRDAADVPDALDVADAPPPTDGGAACSTAPLCTALGWCWVHPLPQGETLHAVWGFGDSVWAVGGRGIILRYDGRCWSREASASTAVLRGVGGTGADDVWAVGDGGAILHRDALGWRSVPSGVTSALTAVWALSRNDAWAVGQGSTVMHWTGGAWARVRGDGAPGATVQSVSGRAADEVYSVGEGELIQRWNGTGFAFERIPSLTDESLPAVFNPGPGELWLYSSRARWLHRPSATSPWQTGTGVGIDPVTRPAIGGSGPSDVWIVGRGGGAHWDGAAVTRDPGLASERLTGVWSGRSGSAWVSGAAGRVLRREGSAWAPVLGASAADADRSYQRFWGVSANDIWAARSGQPTGLEHWDGAAWTPVASPIAAGEFVPALWGTATDDVWAVGLCPQSRRCPQTRRAAHKPDFGRGV